MRNITVKQYALLENASQYSAIENLMPLNNYMGHSMNIGSMPYSNVKYCMRVLSKAIDWNSIAQLFEICFDISEDDFWKGKVVEYIQARNYLIAEFKASVNKEAKMLLSESTDAHLWKMAGSDKLLPYNDTLPLVQLGKGLGQYPFDLGRKPYSEILTLLGAMKTQNEVEADYHKLKK